MLIRRNSSEKQIAAARANGKKSRGPVTPRGKLHSAAALQGIHALAHTVVLKGESPEKFRQLLDALHAELRPESPIEIQLVETMAVARWRQMRSWALEKAAIVAELARYPPPDAAASLNAAAIDQTADACRNLADNSHWPEYIARNEYRHDQVYNRAIELFRRHRAWRREEIKNAPLNPATD